MSLLKLKKVEFEGFRSFQKAHSIELPSNGLVLINGNCSGSGKTNFLYAILQAIGYGVLTHSNVKNWNSNNTSLSIELENGNDSIVISRYPKFSIKLNGKLINGGANVLNEKVKEFLGLPFDILSKLTYRKQKSRGFIYQTNSSMQEFLNAILELDKFENEAEKSHKEIVRLSPSLSVLQIQKSNKEKELADFGDILEPVKPDDTEILKRINSITKDRDTLQNEKEGFVLRNDSLNGKIKQAKLEVEDKYSTKKRNLYEQLEVSRELYKEFSGINTGSDKLNTLNENLKNCKKRIKNLQDAEDIRRQGEDLEKNKLSKEIYDCKKALDGIELKKKQIRDKQKELEALTDSKCPKCLRTWDKALEEQNKIRNDIEALNKETEVTAFYLKAITELETKYNNFKVFIPDPMIVKFKDVYENLLKQIKDEETIINTSKQNNLKQFKDDESKLQKELLNIEQQIKTELANELEILQLELQQNTNKLVDISNLLQQSEKEYSNAQKQLDSIRFYHEQALKEYNQKLKDKITKNIELIKITKELNDIQNSINVHTEWKNVNRTFMSSILLEILDDIANETNNILADVPNVRNCSLRFLTDKETKEGKIKNKITPLININGHEEEIGTVCSGGQDSAIELASDLAIIEVIQRRSGKIPGWLFVDEAFEGLDLPSREACIQILQKYAQNKLVLVIDHASEIKEMFSQVINVVYNSGESTVGQNGK